jgi:hypothetical protein
VRRFCKVLKDNGWIPTKDKSIYQLSYADHVVIYLFDRGWRMFVSDLLVCEGGYASKAYAVVEAELEKLNLIRG